MSLFTPKTALEDFTGDMLPHNRREVFKDVFKLHHRTLLLCGLILFVFLLPLHITALWEAIVKAQISAGLGEKPTEEQIFKATTSIISFGNMRALIDIVFWILFFVGFAGIARVIRQFGWEENVYFRYEFVVGIKDNWAQYSVTGLLVGIVRFICIYIGNTAVLASGQGEIYSYLGLIPTVLFMIFLLPPAMYAVVNMSVYKNSFRQNVKIGFALYAKYFWKTVLAVICCSAVFIPQIIPNLICIIMGRIISSFLLPFIMLGWWLFAYNGLDGLINPKHAPELIGRGTTPISEEGLAEIERRKQLEENKKLSKKKGKASKRAKNKRK